jgi:hypothetical protein
LRRNRFVVLIVLLLAACAVRGAEPEAGMLADRDLVASVDVRIVGDTVQLGLHVTNPTASAVTLEFRTGQRYDFTVRRADGTHVWRWSDDMMFTQALGEETVVPGGWLQYRESWASGGARGRYVVEARLTSSNRPIVLTAEFEL